MFQKTSLKLCGQRESINQQPGMTVPADVSEQAQQPSDSEIRELLAQGRFRESFERLLALYKNKVFHLALSMLRNETQAEDMAQEIFLRIWKGLPGYNGQASLSTWIYTISRNACYTELKKRSTRPTVSLDDPALTPALEFLTVNDDVDKNAALDVHPMLAQLPEKYRQVLTLFYLEQKSYEETAAILAIPLGTVKTFLFRAKQQLVRIYARESALVPV